MNFASSRYEPIGLKSTYDALKRKWDTIVVKTWQNKGSAIRAVLSRKKKWKDLILIKYMIQIKWHAAPQHPKSRIFSAFLKSTGSTLSAINCTKTSWKVQVVIFLTLSLCQLLPDVSVSLRWVRGQPRRLQNRPCLSKRMWKMRCSKSSTIMSSTTVIILAFCLQAALSKAEVTMCLRGCDWLVNPLIYSLNRPLLVKRLLRIWLLNGPLHPIIKQLLITKSWKVVMIMTLTKELMHKKI